MEGANPIGDLDPTIGPPIEAVIAEDPSGSTRTGCSVPHDSNRKNATANSRGLHREVSAVLLTDTLMNHHEDTAQFLWTLTSEGSSFRNAAESRTRDELIRMLPAAPHIVVVPTSRARMELLRTWAIHNGIGEPPEILTMVAFQRRLAEFMASGAPRVLPDSLVDVLLRVATTRCGFRAGSQKLRSWRLVRYAQEGLSVRNIEDLAQTVDGGRRKRLLSAAAKVWSEFNNLVGHDACDRGTFTRWLTHEVQSGNLKQVITQSGDILSRLLVVDTHGVSVSDRDMLAALAKVGWDIGIALLPGGSRSPADQQWLVSRGWYAPQSLASLVSVSNTQSLHSFTSRAEEVRRAFAVVKEAVSGGLPLSEIAICTVGSAEYQRIIREVAHEQSIPINGTERVLLAQTNIAAAVHTAAMVIGRGWQRADVERLVRNPLVRAVLPDVQHLIRVAREERILGGNGPHEWLATCISRLELLRERDQNADDEDDTRRWRERVERAMRALQTITDALPVGANDTLSASRYTEVVEENILRGLGMYGPAQEHEEQALMALLDTLVQYRAVSVDHDLPPMRCSEHLALWWLLVQQSALELARSTTRGVDVLRPAELRGKKRSLLVVVGCVDGEFPATRLDPLDEECIPGLRAAMDREAAIDIANAVGNGGEILFFYPRSVDGAVVLPSSILPENLEHQSRFTCLDATATVLLSAADTMPGASACPLMNTSQEGVVLSELRPHEQEQFTADILRPVSPSRLDLVADCPYKYLSRKVLRLDVVDTDDMRRTPLERGTLLHSVAQRFYKDLAPHPFTFASAEEAVSASVDILQYTQVELWERLVETLNLVVAEYTSAHAMVDVEYRALVGTPSRAGLLRQWLALERADAEMYHLRPLLFEQEIEAQIPMAAASSINTLAVKVRIDRIDVALDDRGLVFQVVDYKSKIGTNHGRGRVFAGRSSQMPIYIAATQQLFTTHGIVANPMRAMYRAFGTQLRSPKDVKSAVVLSDNEYEISSRSDPQGYRLLPFAKQLDHIFGNLANVVADLRSGSYPVRPQRNACSTCDVETLCRKDQWGALPPLNGEDDEESED